MSKQTDFKKGDKVICLEYGRNNTDMIKGAEYTVSEVDTVRINNKQMLKLESHPDWWVSDRFTKK